MTRSHIERLPSASLPDAAHLHHRPRARSSKGLDLDRDHMPEGSSVALDQHACPGENRQSIRSSENRSIESIRSSKIEHRQNAASAATREGGGALDTLVA
jgi:hypothetical protein